MKHTFLLDENILHHAIKGVNERGESDPTCAELLFLIGRNCHTIVINAVLEERYWRQLSGLFQVPRAHLEPVVFLRELMHNSSKTRWESPELPELPAGADIPAEDIPIATVALISHPLVVTADEEFREAINSQSVLGLKALTPAEAIALAQEE